MIRLIVRIDDAAMAAHVGGSVQTTYRTFDIEHAEIESLLRASGEKPNSFGYATLVGASIDIPSPQPSEASHFALVDVPAVESEPVAWVVREVTPSNGRGPNTIITGNVVPRGYEAITPLYANPPRSLSTSLVHAEDGMAHGSTSTSSDADPSR